LLRGGGPGHRQAVGVRDFALEVYLSKWEFAARYHLTASDAQSMSVADLVALADDEGRARWANLWLGYTETYGAPWLRALIASTYDTLAADDILCFAGAEEGLHAAMHALLDAGDHAVVVVPNYQSAETIPLDRCEVSGVSLDPDRGWALDIDAVRAALRPNTKLVSINFPNNPTGKILERDRFDALVALCRSHGIWLFSDEVYRLIERDSARRLPQVADVYERGLSLNVMSKAYGLPGLRIGWIAARDRAVLQRMERIKHYLSICNSAPSEVLAGIALSARETILARNRALATRNVAMLTEFFADFSDRFEWYVPDGGVIGFPRYLGAEGVEAFAEALVDEAGVLVLPASLYRSALTAAPADRFRIGYGRDQLAEGLAAFRAFLSK
jgi:aspartate/methionine/tyrosine aminotransferase